MKKAIDLGIKILTIVGDSRIAIQQICGIILCHKPNLKLLLAEVESLKAHFTRVRFLHVGRAYNQAANYLAKKAKEEGSDHQVSDPLEMENLKTFNSLSEAILRSAGFRGAQQYKKARRLQLARRRKSTAKLSTDEHQETNNAECLPVTTRTKQTSRGNQLSHRSSPPKRRSRK
jgi:hypothetical protein